MERWLAAFPPPPAAELEKQKREDETDTTKPLRVRRRFPDRIDLHGFTREDAARRLRDFVRNSVRGGLRKILVIHGRGLNSPGAAVLPTLVRSELEQNPHVVDFGAAPPSDGGEGATQVFLRRDRLWNRR
ncbi:MAG: Smr/MutS family protein [Spirochaetia bacterium]|nr:Smr/MutS family protein [Spirochaetia bacterium]